MKSSSPLFRIWTAKAITVNILPKRESINNVIMLLATVLNNVKPNIIQLKVGFTTNIASCNDCNTISVVVFFCITEAGL